MARGVLSGFLTGSAASTAVVALISVLSAPPNAPVVTAEAPVAAPNPGAGDASSGRLPVPLEGDPLQPATPVVQAAPSKTSDQNVVPEQNFAAVSRPQTASVPQTLPTPAPEVLDIDGTVSVEGLSPVYPNPKSRPPAAPDADVPATVVTETAAAPVSDPIDVQPELPGSAILTAVANAQGVAPTVPTLVGEVALASLRPLAPETPGNPSRPVVSETPAEPIVPVADIPERVANVATDQDASPAAAEAVSSETVIVAEDAAKAEDTVQVASVEAETPSVSPAKPIETTAEDTATVIPEAETEEEAAPAAAIVVAQAPKAEDDVQQVDEVVVVAPSAPVETPAADLPDETDRRTAENSTTRTDAMRPRLATGNSDVNRIGIGVPATSLLDGDRVTRAALPQLIAGTGLQIERSAQATPTPDAPKASGPALQRFAVDVDGADGRPLMSIILMDFGQNIDDGPVSLEALSSFPYPLTFAVDASLPDAADRAALYRAQGLEVMALVDLPANLTAADTEVALTAALDAVPEAVGVLEGVESGLQGSKEMSDQVNTILSETGHGIVWQPKGLDTAQKLAAREGIASQTLFRDLDSAGQTSVVIRRFLDQAAFKAGQQGAVIMLGRLQPETISALVVWGLQNRASRVAITPVSTVLRVPPGAG